MLLAFILGFIVGAYIECKYCTKIELVVSFVVGLVHKVLGLISGPFVSIWGALKAVFTKKPEAAPAPVAQTAPAPAPAPVDAAPAPTDATPPAAQ